MHRITHFQLCKLILNFEKSSLQDQIDMLYELSIIVAKAALATILICVTQMIVVNYLRVQRFKKETPRIPIASRRNILTGHWGDISYNRGTFQIFEQNHQKLGKTFVSFLNETAVFSTVDLDFIKRMILDEGNTDRFYASNPIHEVEQDSILTAAGSQWKRLRRVYASALS